MSAIILVRDRRKLNAVERKELMQFIRSLEFEKRELDLTARAVERLKSPAEGGKDKAAKTRWVNQIVHMTCFKPPNKP